MIPQRVIEALTLIALPGRAQSPSRPFRARKTSSLISSNIILHKVGARRWMIGWIIDRTHSTDLGVYALAAIMSVGSLLVLTIPGRIVNPYPRP